MIWKELLADLGESPLQDIISRLSFIDACCLISNLFQNSQVFIADSCWAKINNHLSNSFIELGGLLLGEVYGPGQLCGVIKNYTIFIKDAIYSENFIGTPVSLIMGTEIWNRARLMLSKTILIVGWYHSHPNIGAFFSGVDRKTQKGFFRHGYSLGLVMDPYQRQEAWFIGPNSLELPIGNVRKVGS